MYSTKISRRSLHLGLARRPRTHSEKSMVEGSDDPYEFSCDNAGGPVASSSRRSNSDSGRPYKKHKKSQEGGEPPIGTATGEYPTVIESVNNHTVLIIQADCFSRYVGNLSVEYDTSGEVISWDGNPIYLDQNIPKNESIETLLDYYREQINKISNCVLGKTNVLLDHASCLSSECNLGNLITDSMIAYYSNQSDGNSWSKTAVAIINSGAIRSSISKGDISLKDLQNALPFEDRMVYGELQGKHIKTIMETSTAPYFYRKINLQLTLIQVSGLRLVLDQSQPIGSRVVSMKIRCHACDVPAYEDVDSDKYYPIALTKYLANGGDGHHAIKDNLRNSSEGPVFCDIISEYIKKQSPIIIGLDERIIVKRSN
ncbi:nucleotidase-related [Holotrichia oblita]|uniref:Nucleotidase-related n=1 Tax=Holotrichia oblita TaxID=644536 RepID=A0ACB9SJ56_HOLOL|nr:nucleotidase-related [Holotrichia oblita]